MYLVQKNNDITLLFNENIYSADRIFKIAADYSDIFSNRIETARGITEGRAGRYIKLILAPKLKTGIEGHLRNFCSQALKC